MTTNHFDQQLRMVAADTCAAMAFMLPDELGDALAQPPAAAASVTFQGPFCGVLTMSVSAGLMPLLAGNLLGLDDKNVDQAAQRDALKELLNVICGNLLPVIDSAESVFDVGSPSVIPLLEAATVPAGTTPAGRAFLTLDAGTVELALFVEEPVPAGR